MTTEEDFHNHLDANPDDHHARMVFADFLQEQNDPRAAGYRALGKNRIRPVDEARPQLSWYYMNKGWGGPAKEALPADWFAAIEHPSKSGEFVPDHRFHQGSPLSRREIENIAAHAFARLPPERQQELLADPVQMKRRVKYARKRRAMNRRR